MKVRVHGGFRRWAGLSGDSVGGGSHSGGTARDEKVAKPQAERFVVGLIVEKLVGFGLAHIQTDSGDLYSVNRQTPGVEFDKLKEGQQLRCVVAEKPLRILRAELA